MGNNDDELRRRREQNAKDEAEIQRLRRQHQEEQAKLDRQNAEALRAYEKGVQQARKTGGTPPPAPKMKKTGGCAVLLIAGLGGLAGLAAAAGAVVHHFV